MRCVMFLIEMKGELCLFVPKYAPLSILVKICAVEDFREIPCHAHQVEEYLNKKEGLFKDYNI